MNCLTRSLSLKTILVKQTLLSIPLRKSKSNFYVLTSKSLDRFCRQTSVGVKSQPRFYWCSYCTSHSCLHHKWLRILNFCLCVGTFKLDMPCKYRNYVNKVWMNGRKKLNFSSLVMILNQRPVCNQAASLVQQLFQALLMLQFCGMIKSFQIGQRDVSRLRGG